MQNVINEIMPSMYDFVIHVCDTLGDIWTYLFRDITISFGALDLVIDFFPLTVKPIYIVSGLALVVALFKNIFL